MNLKDKKNEGRFQLGIRYYKSLYSECYATMPMLADAHISSLGYLWVHIL